MQAKRIKNSDRKPDKQTKTSSLIKKTQHIPSFLIFSIESFLFLISTSIHSKQFRVKFDLYRVTSERVLPQDKDYGQLDSEQVKSNLGFLRVK